MQRPMFSLSKILNYLYSYPTAPPPYCLYCLSASQQPMTSQPWKRIIQSHVVLKEVLASTNPTEMLEALAGPGKILTTLHSSREWLRFEGRDSLSVHGSNDNSKCFSKFRFIIRAVKGWNMDKCNCPKS